MVGDVPSAGEIRAMIEQVYRLASWEGGGRVDTPPGADGRWVIMQGGVVSTLLRGNEDGSRTVVALFGRYEIEDGVFRYCYDGGSAMVHSAGGATPAAIPVTYGAMMEWSVRRDGEGMVLSNPPASLHMTSRGIDYAENGVVERRWVRIQEGR
jgi:hypothetical protein